MPLPTLARIRREWLPTTPATLTRVDVTSEATTLVQGSSVQFHARGTYSDGGSKDLTLDVQWSSSSPPFATVDTRGLVTAVKPGDLQINASLEGKAGVLPYFQPNQVAAALDLWQSTTRGKVTGQGPTASAWETRAAWKSHA